MNIPKIPSDDPHESLINVVKSLYQRLKECITHHIIDDENEYNNIILHGLSINTSMLIFNILYEELSRITKYKHRDWCELSTTNIINNVNLVIISLIEVNKLEELTPVELVKLLYRAITYQLHEESKIDGLLDNIFYYDEPCNDSSDIDKLSSVFTDSSDINSMTSNSSESNEEDN